jgi:hypothetical protein
MNCPVYQDDALARRGPEQRQHHVLVVRILHEAVGQRRLGAFALGLHLLEHRRLLQLEPDVDREREQDGRDQERDAPAQSENSFASISTRAPPITASAMKKPSVAVVWIQLVS